MFDFLKKRNAADLAAKAAELVRKIRPEVDRLMSYAAGPANKGLTEYYATAYYVWLARETTDWRSLLPCLPGAVLDSLTVMRLDPRDRKKRAADIRGYWHTLEHEEDALLRTECSPLGWLENKHSGLAGIAAGDREFAAQMRQVTCALIRRLELNAYLDYCPPEKPAPRLPLSDIRPQPPRPEQFITLTDFQGNATLMQVLDVITTADGTFACLRKEGNEHIAILKTVNRPDGRAAYAAAEEAEARLVSAVFRTRNPQYFTES